MSTINLELIQHRISQKIEDRSLDICVVCGELYRPGGEAKHYRDSTQHQNIIYDLKQTTKEFFETQHPDVTYAICGECPALIVTDEFALCQLGIHRYSGGQWATNLFGYRHEDTGRINAIYPNAECEADLKYNIEALRGIACRQMFDRRKNKL